MKRINLLDPLSEEFCCQTTCIKRDEIQVRINKMQDTINLANGYFVNDKISSHDYGKLLIDLKKLSTE